MFLGFAKKLLAARRVASGSLEIERQPSEDVIMLGRMAIFLEMEPCHARIFVCLKIFKGKMTGSATKMWGELVEKSPGDFGEGLAATFRRGQGAAA